MSEGSLSVLYVQEMDRSSPWHYSLLIDKMPSSPNWTESPVTEDVDWQLQVIVVKYELLLCRTFSDKWGLPVATQEQAHCLCSIALFSTTSAQLVTKEWFKGSPIIHISFQLCNLTIDFSSPTVGELQPFSLCFPFCSILKVVQRSGSPWVSNPPGESCANEHSNLLDGNLEVATALLP